MKRSSIFDPTAKQEKYWYWFYYNFQWDQSGNPDNSKTKSKAISNQFCVCILHSAHKAIFSIVAHLMAGSTFGMSWAERYTIRCSWKYRRSQLIADNSAQLSWKITWFMAVWWLANYSRGIFDQDRSLGGMWATSRELTILLDWTREYWWVQLSTSHLLSYGIPYLVSWKVDSCWMDQSAI